MGQWESRAKIGEESEDQFGAATASLHRVAQKVSHRFFVMTV